ncbi:hypothetical protein LIER_43580 [Lithospermum erythrorhizon]|uniref:Ubiquitin-like protease family profile domain-containing protein n=1 Tax=Lithospermum erythrorhizon TaxID=34254 RepID=A0AAV3QGQ1_LITER
MNVSQLGQRGKCRRFSLMIPDTVHFLVFVVNLKEEKCEYLNSLEEVQLVKPVEEAANYVARSLLGFLKCRGGKINKLADWNNIWEIPPVPQQPNRTNSCGWFVMKYIEKWDGQGKEMMTFKSWNNLIIPKNEMIAYGRRKITVGILKSPYNDLAKSLKKDVKGDKMKKVEKKKKI